MIKVMSMHAVDKKLKQAVDETSNLIVASLRPKGVCNSSSMLFKFQVYITFSPAWL